MMRNVVLTFNPESWKEAVGAGIHMSGVRLLATLMSELSCDCFSWVRWLSGQRPVPFPASVRCEPRLQVLFLFLMDDGASLLGLETQK